MGWIGNAGIAVQITNKLAYWLLDRYFERAFAFLQRHPGATSLKPSINYPGQTVSRHAPRPAENERVVSSTYEINDVCPRIDRLA
jgi:hypothetical protein